jgi:DNA mismatch repair protein MutS2
VELVDDHTLEVLEYRRIIDMLVSECSTVYGRELASELKPVICIDTIRQWLSETTEAVRMLVKFGKVPVGGIFDIREYIRKTGIGGVLAPSELFRIGSTLGGFRRLKSFFSEVKDCPVLKQLVAGISIFVDIEKAIDKSVSENDEVLDTASERLHAIRKKQRVLQDRIRNVLENITKSMHYQDVLQESIVTMRNGRYVVPVKSQLKSRLPGIVHDRSASGATLFVEPMTVVELNNELKELTSLEEQEIYEILRKLSGMIGAVSDSIQTSLECFAQIDFILAKGRLSLLQNACEPLVSDNGQVLMIEARHPLLKGDVVPINVELGRAFDVLILTGPNTGGKTVTLKTLGLLNLMGQAGLHIPCLSGSIIAAFDHIFADIGDEQSIEQSLSTFSSHMNNIIHICNNVDDNSLVLLDEIGAGTSPEEGSVLAMAIIEHIFNKGSKIAVTTHYGELKAFAYSHERFRNGSVEFDVETLQPTYRLNIGIPGRSNALIIAERLGLSEEVVSRARQLLSQEDIQVDVLISNIERDRQLSEESRKEAERLVAELNKTKSQYEQMLQDLQGKKEEILSQAKTEALNLVKSTQVTTETMVTRLRKEFADRDDLDQTSKEIHGVLQDLKVTLVNEEDIEIEEKNGSRLPEEMQHFVQGEAVFVIPLRQEGTVLSLPDVGGKVEVQVGPARILVDAADLEAVDKKIRTRPEQGNITQVVRTKVQNIQPEIHVRGFTVNEAIDVVDKYLDDAQMAGLERVRIVHGKGSGILRKAIHEFLRTHPRVKAFEMAAHAEGGYGVTILFMK